MLRRRKRRKGDTAELAAQLAPLEEQDLASAAKQIGGRPEARVPQADEHFGAIVVDNNDLKVPKGISDARSESEIMGMEPVVVVILIVLISYIIYIAWQISLLTGS
jgi:hypothetical protein